MFKFSGRVPPIRNDPIGGVKGVAEAYVVDAIRTAGGRRNGRLAGWHPADMAGEILNALVDRSKIDPAAIEDVILGVSRRWARTAGTTRGGGGYRNLSYRKSP